MKNIFVQPLLLLLLLSIDSYAYEIHTSRFNSIEAVPELTFNVDKEFGILYQRHLPRLHIAVSRPENEFFACHLEKTLSSGFDTLPNNFQRRVTGIILNDKQEPLASATIKVKYTNLYTIADANGRFFINVPDSNATIVVTAAGYVSEEWIVDQTTELKLLLTSRNLQLPEVV